jgi:hypothetical protein
MTAEQGQAADRLRAIPGRYRVLVDAEGWPIIPGRYGRLEWENPDTLAVFTARRHFIAKLAAVARVRRYQTGDTEARMLVALEAIPAVASLIRPRRRRASRTGRSAGVLAQMRIKLRAQVRSGAVAEGGGKGAA